MVHFTEEDVRQHLTMPAAVEAMRGAFKAYGDGAALNQTRRRLHLRTGATLHSMAGAYGKYFGTKIYSTHPKHGAHFFFYLFDAETARPLASFEANLLGQIRTGAVSGLAADLLLPSIAVNVAIIGSGFQARSQLEAVAGVREIRSAKVWSRSEEKRTAFAAAVTFPGGPSVEASTSLAAAVDGTDVIITATSAKEPFLFSKDVSNDCLILAMGSNDPNRAEVSADLVMEAVLVVDDLDAAKTEAGDLVLGLGASTWKKVFPLSNFVDSPRPEVLVGPVLFKSVGLGLEDVAAAAVVYESHLRQSY